VDKVLVEGYSQGDVPWPTRMGKIAIHLNTTGTYLFTIGFFNFI